LRLFNNPFPYYSAGKENVYINVGIDKVPIVMLEEGGDSGETTPRSKEVSGPPQLPVKLKASVKVKASYENTMIHQIAVNELGYVVAENSKDNNRQLKDQFKVLHCLLYPAEPLCFAGA
jgi:hypothetical protein